MAPADASAVDAVIVNFNAGDHLLACVRSLRVAGVDSITVADNDSHDGSIAALAAADPGVRVVRTGANLGFGQGNNRGAAGLSRPYLLAINPDATVAPDAVEKLVAALEADDGVGVVGPFIANTDGSRYPSARRFPSMVDATGHALFGLVWPSNPFTRRYRQDDWAPAAAEDVDWISGSCMLFRRTTWEALGGFSDRFFMYMEDVDICWRAWKAGWRVRYEPGAAIVHVGGVSTDQTPYRMIRAHHRAMWTFARQTTSGPARLLLPVMGLGMVARIAVASLHRSLAGRRRSGAVSSVK